MDTLQVVGLVLGALLSENFILVNTMGIGTRLSAFTDPTEARRLGIVLTLVMVTSALLSRQVDMILFRLGVPELRLIAFALLVPATVVIVRSFLHTFLPELSRRLSEYFHLLSSNAAALGGILLSSERGYNMGQTFIFVFFAGVGITVSLMCFAGLGEEVSFDRCPTAFRGIPIRLITAGLMALALVGYYGLHIT